MINLVKELFNKHHKVSNLYDWVNLVKYCSWLLMAMSWLQTVFLSCCKLRVGIKYVLVLYNVSNLWQILYYKEL